MNKNIVLVAETGSDITPEIAEKYGIYLVPMHVSMGEENLDDGFFPSKEICAYYDRTGKVPKTSASSPHDFINVFDLIHERWPEKHILHLAYSAVTTCSYQNALLAAEDRSYVTSIDTKHVSVGQAAVVLQVAHMLEDNPELSVKEAIEVAQNIASQTHMCFIPKNLDYLRAGGRVSNVVALTGNILSLHPCIEIIDGYLLAKKKYRGSLMKIVPKLIREYAEKHRLNKEWVYLICSTGLPEEVRIVAESTARDCGFQKISWMETGCVITCHSGPSSFRIVGVSEKKYDE